MNKTLNQDVTGLDKQFAVLDLQHNQDSGKASAARYVPPHLRGGNSNSANSNSSSSSYTREPRDSRSDRDSQPRYSDRGGQSFNSDRGAYNNNRGNYR